MRGSPAWGLYVTPVVRLLPLVSPTAPSFPLVSESYISTPSSHYAKSSESKCVQQSWSQSGTDITPSSFLLLLIALCLAPSSLNRVATMATICLNDLLLLPTSYLYIQALHLNNGKHHPLTTEYDTDIWVYSSQDPWIPSLATKSLPHTTPTCIWCAAPGWTL